MSRNSDRDNRANQLNPNNSAFESSRLSERYDDDDESISDNYSPYKNTPSHNSIDTLNSESPMRNYNGFSANGGACTKCDFDITFTVFPIAKPTIIVCPNCEKTHPLAFAFEGYIKFIRTRKKP